MLFERTGEEDYIFIGNLGSEICWKEKTDFSFRRVANDSVEMAIAKADLFMIYLCEEHDLLIIGHEISSDYVKYLKENRINIPNTIIIANQQKGLISERLIKDRGALCKIKQYVKNRRDCGHKVYLVPFAVTYLEEQLAEIIDVPLLFSNSTISKQLNNKFIVREMCSQVGVAITVGELVNNKDELYAVCTELFKSFNKVVLKEPYGSSGLGMVIINKDDGYLLQSIATNLNYKNSCLLVEGWYEVEKSCNLQYVIDKNEVTFLGVSRQSIRNGLYCGAYYTMECVRSKHILKSTYMKLLECIKAVGYRGIVGFDSILSIEGKYFPCLEINARFNMSTFVFALYKKMKIAANALHFWEDIVMPINFCFDRIRCLLKEEEFCIENNKGIMYINYSVNGINNRQQECRIHFLVIGEDCSYIQNTKCWIKERLKQLAND